MFNNDDFTEDGLFGSRGISRDVAEGAFYRYEQDNDQQVQDAYRACGSSASAVATVRGRRSPGVVMRRFAVPDGDLAAGGPITPEMRPDWPILTPPVAQRWETLHRHGSMKPNERRPHVARHRDTPEAVVKGCTPKEFDRVRSWLRNWEWEPNQGADHFGVAVPNDLDHAHIPIAKYVFAASAVKQEEIGPHVHAEVYPELLLPWDGDMDRDTPKYLRMWNAHVRGWHTEGSWPDEVEHLPAWDEKHGHMAEVKDDSIQVARRLSWHPYKREERWQRDRVFFALEGCLKEAALVSAGEATFSCPSVTLWEAPELEQFARGHLRGKTVFVVCDSDWEGNESVTRQTLLARDRLRLFLGDENVHATAPPATDCARHKGKHGVDDYRGHKEPVDGLVAWDLVPTADLEHELRERSTRRTRVDGLARNLAFMRWVVTHAAPETGQTRVSLKTVARHLRHHEFNDRTPRGAEEAVKHSFRQVVEDGVLIEREPLAERSGFTSLGQRREWSGLLEVPEPLRAEVVKRTVAELRK